MVVIRHRQNCQKTIILQHYKDYLKTLKAQEQFNYNLILRKTAVLSPQREILHRWLEKEVTIPTLEPSPVIPIEAEKKEAQEENLITKTSKEQSLNTVKREVSQANTSQDLKKQSKAKKAKPKKKETPVAMTYADWVIYSSKGKIPTQEKSNSLEDKLSLIDSFLENRPKIPPIKQDQPKVDLSASNEFNKEELMTETLAKVYLQQKKFKKALYAYQILSLKYPEKNSFFADQIKKIKQLQQKS